MIVFLGYLNQSCDDLEIVSSDPDLVLRYLKDKKGSERDYAYIDVWENNITNLERIPLDDFERNHRRNKYSY